VDGRPVDPVRGPNPLLAGKAGKPVELTLRRPGSAGSGQADRRVVVVPIASEHTLRYQDLIATRRAKVRESSGGRLGYLHVPDMGSRGWAEFHRDYDTEIEHEGLLLDVRENGGGHTSALVVEKLNRKIIAWTAARYGKVASYPEDAPRGPVVTLTDEWAGSDGDIVTQAIKTYQIGPVVGMRTWGGVLGYEDARELVDGTRTTQADLVFRFVGDGSAAENYGVDPDLEVPIKPQDWAAGRDPQLETAVRLALEALEQHPAATPPDFLAG
jgi:tricorn protease